MRYYKAEDVIEAVTSLFRVSALFSGMNDNEKEWREKAEKVLAKLPTIEVSEEVLKATKKFNAYTIADENAEMGMRTMIEPIVEVSEDCISREYVKCINCAENGSYKCSKCDGEMYYKYDKDEPQTYITEDRDTQILDAWQVHHRNTTTVEDAPSVVPSRVEGEWYRQTTDQFDYWECSECGMGVGLDDIKNYCPNCGAKMKGASDGR